MIVERIAAGGRNGLAWKEEEEKIVLALLASLPTGSRYAAAYEIHKQLPDRSANAIQAHFLKLESEGGHKFTFTPVILWTQEEGEAVILAFNGDMRIPHIQRLVVPQRSLTAIAAKIRDSPATEDL